MMSPLYSFTLYQKRMRCEQHKYINSLTQQLCKVTFFSQILAYIL